MGFDLSKYTLPILVIVMIALMWWMNRSAKKAQQRAEDQRNQAIQIGAHVVTTGGFFGTIVAIDGDAVTLESPSGDETVWMRQAIRGVAELPLAPVSEEEYLSESDASADLPSEIDDPKHESGASDVR